MKLYPYNMGSASAKALAQALGIKRIRHHGKPLRMDGVLINWGASAFKRDIKGKNWYSIVNSPECVAKAANKVVTLDALTAANLSVPCWAVNREDASKWLDEGATVVVRHKLNGHSGEGIEIVTPEDGLLPEAPLYTKYIPKTHEYRIHVFQGDAFFVQRKARKKEVPDDQVNWKVRNHANGFIYAHQDVDVPDDAKALAIAAVDALGLDFGAVDMIYNKKQDRFYVLEVNCAPGLEGTSLDKYKEKLEQFR